MKQCGTSDLDRDVRTPGLLLEPFGWAIGPVMRMAMSNARLLAHLADLTAARLHVIAFYLAHCPGGRDELADAELLSTARSRDILERALGRSPRNLQGLLKRLPPKVLAADEYKWLGRLAVNDRLVDAMMTMKGIDGVSILKLADIRPALLQGPLLKTLRCNLRTLAVVSETITWLEQRWHLEATERFAAVNNPEELRRLTCELVRALPPVPQLPPRSVGHARLIETL